jgi:hypothetical protein
MPPCLARFTHAFSMAAASSALVLVSCGGGGGTSAPPAPPSGTTVAQRASAAKATADNNALCRAVAPFYWEIDDRAQRLADGAVGTTYSATSVMPIASASKLIYGAYVAQKRGGVLSADDKKALTFTSGYTSFDLCARGDTVHSCAVAGSNGVRTAVNENRFFYGGGHMQQHADNAMGLGAMDNAALAAEVSGTLQLTAAFAYVQPQPAGGVSTTPTVYAGFLRKLLDGSLQMTALLGTDAVCTSVSACGGASVYTPFPPTETPRYSLGHWVEDSTVSDGAFSSAGAFGFYPWIDAGKTYYGILARMDTGSLGGGSAGTSAAAQSMYCGRLIRKAWLTATAVP